MAATAGSVRMEGSVSEPLNDAQFHELMLVIRDAVRESRFEYDPDSRVQVRMSHDLLTRYKDKCDAGFRGDPNAKYTLRGCPCVEDPGLAGIAWAVGEPKAVST